MKYFIVIPFFLLSTLAHSQLAPPVAKCYPSNWTYYYFGFHSKPQIASETLVAQANQAVGSLSSNTNGFITARFLVNCRGERGEYEVLEMDNAYQKTKFDKSITNKVLGYVKSINIWQKGISKSNSQAQDYHAFITFKFENGKITEILP